MARPSKTMSRNSGGSWISQRGAPTQKGCANLLFGIFLPENYMNIIKKLDSGEGASLVPPRSATEKNLVR